MRKRRKGLDYPPDSPQLKQMVGFIRAIADGLESGAYRIHQMNAAAEMAEKERRPDREWIEYEPTGLIETRLIYRKQAAEGGAG
jgi:hypothetical protein